VVLVFDYHRHMLQNNSLAGSKPMLKKLFLSVSLSTFVFAPSAMAQSYLNQGGMMLTPPANTGAMVGGLPATVLDSFVQQAGGQAELIYGDEGVYDIPPYFEFTVPHRINSGIFGQSDAGLTTGHGSWMPDAWGGDEFVKGPEWSQSGPSTGNAASELALSAILGGANPVNSALNAANSAANAANYAVNSVNNAANSASYAVNSVSNAANSLGF
jgi:hypothetical protein